MNTQVVLHIYDLGQGYTNEIGHPFGLGFYHTGLQIYDCEFSYGANGAFTNEPQRAYGVIFRESRIVGVTDKSPSQIQQLAAQVAAEFDKEGYHFRQRNCNHYSKALAESILGKQCKYPNWVNRMAQIGNKLSFMIPDRSLNKTQVPSSAEGVSPVTQEKPTFNAFHGKGKALGSTPSPVSSPSLLKRIASWNRDEKELPSPSSPASDGQNVVASKVATDREKILMATQSRLRLTANNNLNSPEQISL
jgi:hypothetical protein